MEVWTLNSIIIWPEERTFSTKISSTRAHKSLAVLRQFDQDGSIWDAEMSHSSFSQLALRFSISFIG
jgi:hypothetical protein